jgi:iron complex outermembrane receptor protein
MDNISLSYDFAPMWNKKLGLRIIAGVQNVFTITKYTGLDPEIAGGIDRNFYPRSRIFTLGVNLSIF